MNNEIIKMKDYDEEKYPKYFIQNRADKEIIIKSENNLILSIARGKRSHIDIYNLESTIRTINYFENFYDEDKKVIRFYEHLFVKIKKDYSIDDFVKHVESFISEIEDNAAQMNNDNIEENNIGSESYIEAGIMINLLIPLLNYYFTIKRVSINLNNTTYEVFNPIINKYGITNKFIKDIVQKNTDMKKIYNEEYLDIIYHNIINNSLSKCCYKNSVKAFLYYCVKNSITYLSQHKNK